MPEVTIPAGGLDVLTIGHALVDVLAHVDDGFLDKYEVTKGIMDLVSEQRAHELTEAVGDVQFVAGGSAANTAAGVVDCGGTAGYVGTVADDIVGASFAVSMADDGVVYRTPAVQSFGMLTGRSVILISPDGERSMNTAIGAAALVSLDHMDIELVSAAKITYFEGYMLDDENHLAACRAAATAAHAAGRQFSMTLSDPFCVDRHRDIFLSLLDGSIDICFGNDEELCRLFEVSDFEEALDLIAGRCSLAAITRGARGSVLVSGEHRVIVAADPVKVVDTTGAGDAYAAGVLTGLAKGWSLEDCGRMGSRAAGAVISVVGARIAGPVTLG